jgi:glucokinase
VKTKHGKSTVTIGVDIGGTKISIGVVNEAGSVRCKTEIPTGPDYSYKSIGQKILHGINALLAESRYKPDYIQHIGFGIPGTTSSRNGFVGHAPNLGWYNVPFGAFMKELADHDLYFVQETHAAVLAEYLFGAGRGCENLACVAIGTGIGCGLMINGKLYRGAFNTAGEFGHILVVKDGNSCACGKNGCLEAYGSGTSIQRILGEGEFPEVIGMSTEEIFRLAAEGRNDIKEAIIGLVEYIGMGLVNVVNLLSPEKILLTGGLAEQDELVVRTLNAFVRHNAYSLAAEKVAVEKAALGKNAPMIGAAMLYRFIEPYSIKKGEEVVHG